MTYPENTRHRVVVDQSCFAEVPFSPWHAWPQWHQLPGPWGTFQALQDSHSEVPSELLMAPCTQRAVIRSPGQKVQRWSSASSSKISSAFVRNIAKPTPPRHHSPAPASFPVSWRNTHQSFIKPLDQDTYPGSKPSIHSYVYIGP